MDWNLLFTIGKWKERERKIATQPISSFMCALDTRQTCQLSMFELLIEEWERRITFDHNYLQGLRQTNTKYLLGVNDIYSTRFSLFCARAPNPRFFMPIINILLSSPQRWDRLSCFCSRRCEENKFSVFAIIWAFFSLNEQEEKINSLKHISSSPVNLKHRFRWH